MKQNSSDGEVYLNVRFQRMTEINVYLYGGLSRSDALESVIENNVQAVKNELYSIKYDKGMLVIAYPNLNKNETEFAMSYWVGPKLSKTMYIEEEQE